jgi:ribosome assembly protein YihI (activator of Der GTPase)
MAFTENRELASRAGKLGTRKGVPNRVNHEVRKSFQLLVENNLEKLQKDLDKLEPKDRIRFILDMAKFILPTLQAVSVDDLREEAEQGFNTLIITLKNNGNDTDN